MKQKILELIWMKKHCLSRAQYNLKNEQNKLVGQEAYFPIVGDPCYQYNEKAKFKFFNDEYCSFLFLIASNHIRETLPNTQNFIE